MNKLSQEEAEKRFKEKKLLLLENYVSGEKKVKIKCFCGNEFSTTPHLVFSGMSSSCGCILDGKSSPRWKGCGEISGVNFNRIRQSAKRDKLKNHEFNITIKYIWNLFLKQQRKCAISGVDINFVEDYVNDNKNQTASLDRINSNKGYVIGNVQWVHKRINEMKMEDDVDDFYRWIEIIHRHKINKDKR